MPATLSPARRSLAVLLCAFLAAAAIHAGSPTPSPQAWWAARPGSPEESATVAVVSRTGEGLRARVTVPGFLHGRVDTAAGPRTLLEIPGAGLLSELGRPRLPVLRRLVEVPAGADVSAALSGERWIRVPLAELGGGGAVLPVQPPVPKLPGASVPWTEDATWSVPGAAWPAEEAAVTDRAVVRGRTVALVEVRAARLVDGALELLAEGELAVGWKGGSASAGARERTRLASDTLDPVLDADLLGGSEPSSRAAAGGAARGAEGMLVVVHDAFLSAVQPLADWKAKTGYRVEVVTTSSLGIPLNDAAVKAAIQSRYDSWTQPSLGFVLLVGDTDFVPIHTGNGGGNSQVTDNWYACTAGTDYLPDLAIARISTRTAQETQDVVDKLLTYQRATFASDGWVKKVGFVGTSDSSHYAMIETTHDWCIDTYATPNGYLPTAWSHGHASSDRHYYTTSATTAQIAASIDEGRSIVNYSGHGATTSWQGPTSNGGYDQDDVRANANDGMYPFVIGNACVTGSLAVSECFAETFLKVPHKGAIGYWGASNNSYWDEDDWLQRSMWGRIFPMDQTPPLGVLLNRTKLDLYTRYGPVANVAYYYDMYNLLSEPSLSLWTRAPRAVTATYPAALPIGQSTFEVTVTVAGGPAAGALVAVRREADAVFEAGYTDAAGRVTFTLDPAPVSVGPMEVTVTGHDLRPHEGASQVIAPDGPWLAYRSHAVDDAAGGDGDGVANPGETIVLPVTVENVGMEPGAGLAGTLSTTTPAWVEILDPSAAFPDLAVHAQGTTLPDHFRVRVAPSAPDGAAAGLELHWTASDGSWGTSAFAEIVAAPDFAYAGQAVDDTAGGNGNGVAGPGETVDLSVTVANSGHRAAHTVHGVLTTASPYVTILEGEADWPDLGPGASGSGSPAFRLLVSPSAPDRQPVAFELALSEQGTPYAETVAFEMLVSSCRTVSSTDVPKAISDNSVAESRIDLPLNLEIAEVNVGVTIAHTYIGDLRVNAISPEGTVVRLHDRSGGSTDNLQTWYDTQTAPVDPLSGFNGQESAGTWWLKVEDLAGGDTGSLAGWSLEVCGPAAVPHPVLSMSAHAMSDAGSCDPDGYADVGETVAYTLTVSNTGNAAATGLVATLSTPARVEIVTPSVPLADLAPGASVPVPFTVRIGAVACREAAAYTLTLGSAEGTWTDGFTDLLELDGGTTTSTEDLEHGGAAPAGWTHRAIVGTDDWRVVSTRNHTAGGAYAWFSSNPTTAKDDVLLSPEYVLPSAGTATLEFWHYEDLESGYDGGVVEISDDGGATWTDLGAAFTEGAYDRTLTGSGPLAGRGAWTGTVTAWRRTTADLASWLGRTVTFRFRLGCDGSQARTGWWIDDVTVTTVGTCDEHACGVPGEARDLRVDRSEAGVVVTWRSDPLALTYRVYRSPAPSGPFADVTGSDPDPADTRFVDAEAGTWFYLVREVGPDGMGP